MLELVQALRAEDRVAGGFLYHRRLARADDVGQILRGLTAGTWEILAWRAEFGISEQILVPTAWRRDLMFPQVLRRPEVPGLCSGRRGDSGLAFAATHMAMDLAVAGADDHRRGALDAGRAGGQSHRTGSMITGGGDDGVPLISGCWSRVKRPCGFAASPWCPDGGVVRHVAGLRGTGGIQWIVLGVRPPVARELG